MIRSKKIIVTSLCLLLLLLIGGFIYISYLQGSPVSEQTPEQVREPDTLVSDKLDSVTINETSSEDTTSQVSTESNKNVENEPKPANTEISSVQSNSPEQPKPNQSKNETPPVDEVPEVTIPTNDAIDKDNDTVAPTTNAAKVDTIQQELGKPVNMTDLLNASFIILKKLDKNEINFLFGFSNDTYTKEDLENVRSLLLSKLTADDIKTLRTLGQKYGKKLEILDPSVPIE